MGTSGQGYNGGISTNSTDNYRGSGGGGAGGTGGNASASGVGGNFLSVAITGLSINYSKGGSGGNNVSSNIGAAGASNTGNAGNGGAGAASSAGGNGGSGVVILRMPTANYSGTTTGAPTVTTDGSDTILTYTTSGTYTA